MENRYIVFDVETPNPENARMSAIGVTVVDHGEITENYYTLVNPETWFAPFHIRLTGITPAAAADAPDFGELWPALGPVLDSGILVAHNAPFDLSVLAKCLRGYCIDWHRTVPYVCACRMSRRLLPQLPNHKLNTLSACLGLELAHHHAGSDSAACAGVLLHLLRTGHSTAPFLRQYDLWELRTLP